MRRFLSLVPAGEDRGKIVESETDDLAAKFRGAYLELADGDDDSSSLITPELLARLPAPTRDGLVQARRDLAGKSDLEVIHALGGTAQQIVISRLTGQA